MKKKLIGLALSAAMLFSVLSVPAFAAAPEESADPALTTEQTAAEEENCFFTSSSTEEEKEPNSITYVALGDSITFGDGVKATRKTDCWEAKLEKLLNEQQSTNA